MSHRSGHVEEPLVTPEAPASPQTGLLWDSG
jgi:hypothetical protein